MLEKRADDRQARLERTEKSWRFCVFDSAQASCNPVFLLLLRADYEMWYSQSLRSLELAETVARRLNVKIAVEKSQRSGDLGAAARYAKTRQPARRCLFGHGKQSGLAGKSFGGSAGSSYLNADGAFERPRR